MPRTGQKLGLLYRNILRAWCERHGGHIALAEKIGVTRNTIMRGLRGDPMEQHDALLAFAEAALRVEPDLVAGPRDARGRRRVNIDEEVLKVKRLWGGLSKEAAQEIAQIVRREKIRNARYFDDLERPNHTRKKGKRSKEASNS